MRIVGVVLYGGIRPFDYGVVTEVWGVRRPGCPDFELRRCGEGPVAMEHGAVIGPSHGLDALAGCDLVVVPGCVDPSAPVSRAILDALRAAHTAGVTIASLCAGAFVLAEAGLLDGRRAVTHWALTGDLAERYPAVRVRPDVLFAEEDGVWSSAGTAAGIDLCLHLVRLAHGAAVANTIARRMVTAAHRLIRQRVAEAQRLLETTDLGVEQVAARSGLGTATMLRRHFARVVGVSPTTYRRSFAVR